MKTSSEFLGEYQNVHMNVFGTPLRVMEHGEGCRIWDVDGKEYLDFLAGIAVNALGYAHKTWTEAISRQAAKLAHVSNYFATPGQIELACKLLRLAETPEGSRVYFCNSGTEANEAALKLARLHGHTLTGEKNKKTEPARIIALTHGFHGRTLGSLSATWKPAIRNAFEPLIPGIEFVEASDEDDIKRAFDESDKRGPVSAVILELIQGEAGVLPVGAEYSRCVRKLCDDFGALMIIDEVQTGIGRTGAWFAFQREDLSGGITPDAITFAKGAGSGFPIGGLITFGNKVSSLFTPGSHGSTFAGNPLAAAAGLATIEAIESENLIDNAEKRGIQLREGISGLSNPLFESVRGQGLLNAIVLTKPCAHAAMQWALEHGLIINAPSPDVLRLAPPLIVSEEEMNEAIKILSSMPEYLEQD